MIHSQKIDHRSVNEHDGHSILLYVYCIRIYTHLHMQQGAQNNKLTDMHIAQSAMHTYL